MKKFVIAALAATAIATPAAANDFSVAFSGERAVECAVTGYEQTISFGALDRDGDAATQTDAGIDLFCNQPFAASVKSTNGYLKLTASNPGNLANNETTKISVNNPGFAAGVDYGVLIPGVGLVGTEHLAAGVSRTISSNIPARNIQNASATWDTRAAAAPLLGGGYTDTLILTLTPNGV